MRHHRTLGKLIGRHVARHGKEFVGVELGVFRGDLSVALLAAFTQLHLHLVDTWSAPASGSAYLLSGDGAASLSHDEHMNNKMETLTRVEPYRNRITIWHCTSHEAAQAMNRESVDVIFIDAEHTKDAVLADIRDWWPRMKRGGLVAGHDYGHRRFPGVKEAVDEFTQRNKLELGVGNGKVWWCFKPC